MAGDTVRATVYLETALHRALRLKAATVNLSMSEIVNDAVRAALREDEEESAWSYRTLTIKQVRIAACLVHEVSGPNNAEEVIARYRCRGGGIGCGQPTEQRHERGLDGEDQEQEQGAGP